MTMITFTFIAFDYGDRTFWYSDKYIDSDINIPLRSKEVMKYIELDVASRRVIVIL